MPKGRPPKLTPALRARVAELLWLAYTDDQIGAMCGVSYKTIARARSGGFCPDIQKAALEREEPFRRKLWESKQGIPGGVCWMLERRYPHQFAKPEITLGIQNNFTQNNLSISITAGEAAQLEAAASPVRDKVKALYASYRPGNGDGKIT